jgi:hypothetical protein
MKHIWEFYLQGNMVDLLLWLVSLAFAIRYGVLRWRDKESSQGWLYVLFLCFYGGFLIYRLGTLKFILFKLILLCTEAGIDLTGIL